MVDLENVSKNNQIEKILALAEKAYEEGFHLTVAEGSRPDISAEWAVRYPPYNLSGRFGTSYFQRQRWFDSNPYPTPGKPAKLLKSTAPAFIEEWETWSSPKKFLDLLNQWQPDWLQKTVGTPLGALQLVVDVADQLLIREHLTLGERSPIMTVLLTSAESLLKWPAHFLTQMHQERNHPLHELRSHAVQLWNEHQIQRAYLQKCAMISCETLRTTKALHTELVRLLTTKLAKIEMTKALASDAVLLPQFPTSMTTTQKQQFKPSNPLQDPTIKVTLQIRKRTPQDALLDEMAKRSKQSRHALDRGFAM